MKRYCLALNLVDDEQMIAEYESWHQKVPPAILQSFYDSGIEKMEIYRTRNRLFMILEVSEGFSFERKEAMDLANPEVQQWEKRMSRFQQLIPGTPEGQKWVSMKKLFEL